MCWNTRACFLGQVRVSLSIQSRCGADAQIPLGLGVASLPSYTHIIRSTFPLRWQDSDEDLLLPHLAIVDADLAQAIQSSKEEVAAGYLESEEEIASAKETLGELYGALEESKSVVETWGGEFCFDRVRQSTRTHDSHLIFAA